jgi:peptide/nickel transport system permease protein
MADAVSGGNSRGMSGRILARWDGARRSFAQLSLVERFAFVTVLLILVLAVFGRMLAPYDPEKPDLQVRLLGPTLAHLFGTDETGMDILSRVLSAPRVDVTIAVVASFLSVVIGAPIGVMVGYFEAGRIRVLSLVSQGILRLLDIVQAFPVFVLALVLVAIGGQSIGTIIAALTFVNMPMFVRIVRAEVLSLRERPYAESARVVGNPDWRVAFRHLLPNALAPVIVQVSTTMGFAILLTAGLSFVGAGIAAPTPEFGSMISTGAPDFVIGFWWPSLFPGLALGLTVFAFGSLGQAVVRMSDPTTSGALLREGRGGVVISSDEPIEETTVGLRPGLAGLVYGCEAELAESTAHGLVVGQAESCSVSRRSLVATGDECGSSRSSSDRMGERDPSPAALHGEPLLDIVDLTVAAGTGRENILESISLSLAPGEILGVVGESGAGKSVLVRSVLGLLPEGVRVVRGDVRFRGVSLLTLPAAELSGLRGVAIAPILPNAKAQLNPVIRVGSQMKAIIEAHGGNGRYESRQMAIDALKAVQIADPARTLKAYPHELSGGMAQRVCIALALIRNPALIVADEPTFGLDVTVQRQVLDIMTALVKEHSASQLIVTRDLGIVAQYCQRVAVMRAGRIVEVGSTAELFESPIDSYTARLLVATRAGRSSAALSRAGAE